MSEKVRRASGAEKAKMTRLLDEHLEEISKGLYRYKGTWSDQRIAQEVGCPVASVPRFRRDAYGELKKNKVEGDAIARIEYLEGSLLRLVTVLLEEVSDKATINEMEEIKSNLEKLRSAE
jgi:hypothetical protein